MARHYVYSQNTIIYLDDVNIWLKIKPILYPFLENLTTQIAITFRTWMIKQSITYDIAIGQLRNSITEVTLVIIFVGFHLNPKFTVMQI
jgi:hypothetical protein